MSATGNFKARRLLDCLARERAEWVRAVTTGPNFGFEIFVPRRQDRSERTINPGIRSADLIVAPLIFFPKIDKELREACGSRMG